VRQIFVWICVAAIFSANGCKRQSHTGVSVDSSFRPFVPSNVVAISGVDFDALRKTTLYQRHEAAIRAHGFDAMVERLGIDPRRDVNKFLIVWNGKQPLVMVKGRFDQETIGTKLVSLGATRTSYQEYTLFLQKNQPNQLAVGFIEGNLMLAGPLASVQEAIEAHSNGLGGIPDVLKEDLEKLPADDQIWEVSRGPLLENIPLRQDVESALSNIATYVSRTRAGFAVASGVRFDSEIICISDAGAKRVRDAIRGSVGLARLATNNNNLDLLRLWDAVKIVQDGPIVDLSADLAPDLADTLLANASEFGKRAREELQQR